MLEKYRKAYAERIIDRAGSYVAKGWLESAVHCYEGFLKQHWNSPEIRLRLGRCIMNLEIMSKPEGISISRRIPQNQKPYASVCLGKVLEMIRF